MTHYLPEGTYEDLISGLSQAFMVAATSANTDLSDELAQALSLADIMPESCRDASRSETALDAMNRLSAEHREGAEQANRLFNRPAPTGNYVIDVEGDGDITRVK